MDAPNVFRDFKIVPTKQSLSISVSPGSKSSTITSASGNSLIPSKKENSMVRFDKKALAKKAGVDHRYLPHIHRQKTEILPKSHVLEHLEELNMLLPEDISHRDSAENEANKILNKFVPSLKAVSNLDFKTFYFVENEVQFHQEPRTLYCILPFKYDCAHVKHLDPGYVTFRLPKADSRNDSYKCLRSDEGTQLSPVKFHSHFEQLFTKTIDKLMKAHRKVRFEEKLKQENEKKISCEENKELVITEGESELQKLIDSSMQDAIDEITIDDNVLNNSVPSDDQNLIQNAIDADDATANSDLPIHLDNNNGGDATDMKKTSLDDDNPENVALGEDQLSVPDTGSERRISQSQRISVTETCESGNLTIQHSEEPKSPRLNWKKIVEKDKPLTFKLDCDWFLEIVPAIFKAAKEPVYVTKAYTDDTNPTSDLRWRICFVKRETKILKSIGKTDKDLRLATIKLVTAILKCDSRLNLLDEYQIQTCLLHEMDDCVDENPRWQRQTLEPCVKSLINKVFTFISGKNLPHFFIPDVNLLDNWTASDYDLAKSALERTVSSDIVLCNLVQKCINQVSSSRHPSPPPSSLSTCSVSSNLL